MGVIINGIQYVPPVLEQKERMMMVNKIKMNDDVMPLQVFSML